MPIRTLEDIEKIEAKPPEAYISARSTYEMLAQAAAAHAEKTALCFFADAGSFQNPVRLTYRQLLGRVHQTANLLSDFGIGPDDAVSIILPNLPQTHFALWGSEASAIASPINPALSVEAIRDIMNAAAAKALIALGPAPNTDIWEKVLRVRGEVPTLKAIFQVLGPGDEKDGVYSYEAALERYRPEALQSRRDIAPDEIAAYFHTGGTTGAPKLARHTHRNEVHNAWAISVAGGLVAGDTLLCGLPLYHVNGVIVTGLAPFSVGATIVILTPLGYRAPGLLQNFFKIVEFYKANFFSAVPTVYAALAQIPVGNSDVSSLQFALCGAAPMPVGVFESFEKQTGLRILEGYGLTEGTCANSVNPKDGERRIGSIGFRLPFQEMKVVKVDRQGMVERDCRPNEIGVIAIRGPNVFTGYVQEEANRSIWLGDGWLRTGDLGRQDSEGYFWITGREKDLIIRGGHNIDPAQIESVLSTHPAVALSAAVGKPDAHAGEAPVAFVLLKPQSTAEPQELVRWCRERVDEPAAVPKEVRFLDEMPLTSIGKVSKLALRHLTITEACLEALAELRPEHPELTAGVEDHPVYGILVVIRIHAVQDEQPGLEDKIRQLLSPFAMRYKILWGPGM